MIVIPKQIRNILLIVLLLLLLFLLKGWLKDKIITGLGGYTDKETEVVIETEVIKGKVDTIAVFNHYVKTRGIILNPEPEIIFRDRVPSTTGEGDTTPEKLKKYSVDISDTLLIGTAIVINDFKGNLQDLELNYKPLFPKYITRVDTIRITKTVTETLTNERAKLGAGIGYNNLSYGSILASYTTKKGWQFIGEYGKNLQTTTIPENIDLQSIKGLITPDQDLISIKIIKNF